jgi:hypothetical protein
VKPSPASEGRKIPGFSGAVSRIRLRYAHLNIARHPFIENHPRFPLDSQALRDRLQRNYRSGPDRKSFDK